MTGQELAAWINNLIARDKLDLFYNSKYFRKVKAEVLKADHYECQRCKEHGKLTIVRQDLKRSGVVHHVQYVRKYPELALSKYYTDNKGLKQRNLITLCNPCHEIVHDRFSINEDAFVNVERW